MHSLSTAFVTSYAFNSSAFAPSRTPSNVEPKKAQLFFIRFLNSTHRGRSRIPIPFQWFNTKTLSLKSYDKSHEVGRQKLFKSTCAFALFTIRLWWEPSSVHDLAWHASVTWKTSRTGNPASLQISRAFLFISNMRVFRWYRRNSDGTLCSL